MAIPQGVQEFLKADEDELIIDVRSEGEYLHGHIPGAINLPLLNNEERHIVGICYKKEGREKAVQKGFELVGHKFSGFLSKALAASPSRKIKVYCWRGGMRSNIMAWVLSLAGFRVSLLKGGYKEFRHWVLEECSKDWNLIVVGGKTGSGKTELLQEIRKTGEQVIDLEFLANHKGSAFGGLGQSEQPGYEHFENLLAMEFRSFNSDTPVWLENESRLIGSVKIPDILFDNIRKAPVVEVSIPEEVRVDRLLKEYGHFDPNILAENTKKLERRLGNLRMNEAVEKILSGEMRGWIKDVLTYYDKTYLYGKSLRKPETIKVIVLPDDNFQNHISKFLETAKDLIKEKNAGICS